MADTRRLWPRLLCLLVSGGLLALIFARLDLAALGAALRGARPGWLVAAFLAYGLSLLCGAWRWHVTLHVTRQAVHLTASMLHFLIGHLLFLLSFGTPLGGLARAGLYARHYRLRLAETAATAPLDGVLATWGTIVIALLACGSVLWDAQARAQIEANFLPEKTALVLGGLLLAALFFSLRSLRTKTPPAAAARMETALGAPVSEPAERANVRPRAEPEFGAPATVAAPAAAWRRGWRSFHDGAARLATTPWTAFTGTLFAAAGQLALCAVFAACLQAVHPTPLPWGRAAWAFIAVMVLGALPFTVAGAGARELAAVALLRPFGVTAGEAVAAALLTLALKLAWSALGALAWQREESRRAQAPARKLEDLRISVVIPALNEEAALPATLASVRALPEVVEIIVVDGGSTDATRARAAAAGARVLAGPPGRGRQMRLGAAAATGDVIWLLHADTTVPPDAGRALQMSLRDPRAVGGGFWKVFRDPPWLLRGSRWRCFVRHYLGRRVLGDQGMFIRREELAASGGVPDVALMEDWLLSRRLRARGRLALADAVLVTDARRFRERGVLQTWLRMAAVAWRFRLGASDEELRRHYER